MYLLIRQGAQEIASIIDRFAHSDDSPRADGNTGLPDPFQGLQAILEGPGGNDFSVKLGGGIEIVIVGSQPRVLEPSRLRVGQHPQRAARLHPQGAHAAHHRQDGIERRAVFDFSPGSAHAEAGRTRIARRLGRGQHFLDCQQLLRSDAGVVPRGLRAVLAVFRTASGLYRKQRAKLHRIFAKRRSMDGLRPVDQPQKRRIVDRPHLRQAPIPPRPVAILFGHFRHLRESSGYCQPNAGHSVDERGLSGWHQDSATLRYRETHPVSA